MLSFPSTSVYHSLHRNLKTPSPCMPLCFPSCLLFSSHVVREAFGVESSVCSPCFPELHMWCLSVHQCSTPTLVPVHSSKYLSNWAPTVFGVQSLLSSHPSWHLCRLWRSWPALPDISHNHLVPSQYCIWCMSFSLIPLNFSQCFV